MRIVTTCEHGGAEVYAAPSQRFRHRLALASNSQKCSYSEDDVGGRRARPTLKTRAVVTSGFTDTWRVFSVIAEVLVTVLL